jgi:thiol-disulfide isomerase/thioredoxin
MNNSESNINTKSQKKLIFIIFSFVIFPLLVIFPLITVYLSSSGLKANKKLKAEMTFYKDSVRIPPNNFLSLYKNIEKNISFFKEKIIVVQFYDNNCKDCDSVWFEMKRIQKEFAKKTKRVQLLTYVLIDEPIDSLKKLIDKYKPDTSSWEILVSKDDMYDFLKKLKVDSIKAVKTILLADRRGIIANYYDATKSTEINNLMRHSTMLLPAKEDRKKIKYKREKDLYQ